MTTIEDRVQAGATLLDQESPGWAERINQHELNLGHCGDCILGQIYGLYHWGIHTLGLDSADDEELALGFNAPSLALFAEVDEEVWAAEIAALASAWLAEIRTRLAPVDDGYTADPVAVGMGVVAAEVY